MSVEELQKRASTSAAADGRVPKLQESLGSAASHAYLVGGAVRDFALGRPPRELDVLVEGDVLALVADLDALDVKVHERFLTATVTFDWGEVDFAAARRESYPKPGALPDIETANVVEDRERRDFTINCLRLEMNSLEALDDSQGWEDLDAGLLRVLHSGSFNDDPTRLWRLARYTGRLLFAAEPETARLAAEAISDGVLRSVSSQRIGQELVRTVDSSETEHPIVSAIALGLFDGEGDLSETAELLGRAEDQFSDRVPLAELRLALLCAAGWSPRDATWNDLGLSESLSKVVAAAGELTQFAAEVANLQLSSDVDERCSRIPLAVVVAGSQLFPNPMVDIWLAEHSLLETPLAGADLIAAGVSEGPSVGIGLRAARQAMLNNSLLGRAELLEVAINAARES